MTVSATEFGLSIRLEAEGDLAARFGLTERAVMAAKRRAINKTARWLRTQYRRQISRLVKVPQKSIDARIKLQMVKPGRKEEGFVWIGTKGINPVTAGRRGRPSGTGYRIGPHYFEGGFLVEKSSGIYKRKTSARLPITRQTIPIDAQSREIIRRLEGRGNRELAKKFEQELTFEMHKVLR